MQKLALSLAFCGVAAVAAAAAFNGHEQSGGSPMLSQLNVGQQVKLERALSGGYNVNLLNERYLKSYERSSPEYVPMKIIEVGRDFIVVEAGRGFKQTIAAHAIDVITQLPDAGKAGGGQNDRNNPGE